MKVYFSDTGHVAHYYKDCHQLQKAEKNSLKTAEEEDVDRSLCQDCKKRRAFTEIEADE